MCSRQKLENCVGLKVVFSEVVIESEAEVTSGTGGTGAGGAVSGSDTVNSSLTHEGERRH